MKTSTEEENSGNKNTEEKEFQNRKTNSFASSVLDKVNPSLWRHCLQNSANQDQN
jgi:hypothetical protein